MLDSLVSDFFLNVKCMRFKEAISGCNLHSLNWDEQAFIREGEIDVGVCFRAWYSVDML